MPLEGLSMAALLSFAAAHAGQWFAVRAPGDADAPAVSKLFEALTTAEVVQAVVKRATLGTGPGGEDCTYAELLLAQARTRMASCDCAGADAAGLRMTCVSCRAQRTRMATQPWRAPRASSATPGRTCLRTCLQRWRRAQRTRSRARLSRTIGSVWRFVALWPVRECHA